MTAASPTALAPDIAAGLRRLKLAAMRQLAPDLLLTAKTQRWAPEEFLRTLIEAEIASREASNARTRMRNAAFPVIKTLNELDRSVSSIPGPTLDYLASLEWITARENLVLVGPAGTRKSHLLTALGIAAVNAGHKVRYYTAADLVDALYRALADNSVGKTIARHGLIDAIPAPIDVAVPRGSTRPTLRAPIRLHQFEVRTFDLGRDLLDVSARRPVGLYSAERSIIDVVRLRHREGSDIAWEALRRWLAQPGRNPAKLIDLATRIPGAESPLRHALEVLL